MAKSTLGAAAPTPPDFEDALSTVSSAASTVLFEIAALARVGLDRLEDPRHAADAETVALLLQTIWSQACQANHVVSSEASACGLSLFDRQLSRHRARTAAAQHLFAGGSHA